MRRSTVSSCCLILFAIVPELRPAAAQSRSEEPVDCGADICLQTGVSYWRYHPTQYCEGDVCLRDKLEDIAHLNWDRLMSGRLALIGSNRNPFVGLDNAEYQRFREFANAELSERVGTLAQIRAACQPTEFSLRLDIPGYDVVVVSFSMPVAADGEQSSFQVTKIHRTYRGLPGGSVGWWVRWISNRFPGISLLDGEPEAFASYEIGLYMGGLVLTDIEYRPETAEAYAAQSACAAR